MDRYGLIDDLSSAALVGMDGSIDWCCFPRFDSASVFAAILDRDGGSFQIAPLDAGASADQSYLPSTNILCTRFQTSTGEMSVTDFMPVGKVGASSHVAPHEIHRIVRCESGSVDVLCTFRPRLDYARAETGLVPFKNGVLARGGGHSVTLTADIGLEVSGDSAVARFSLQGPGSGIRDGVWIRQAPQGRQLSASKAARLHKGILDVGRRPDDLPGTLA